MLSPRFTAVAALVAFLFFAKFTAYAWFITPLWDIPDESGHYSYANDVSRGELPILGETRVDEEVAHSWISPGAQPGRNWIAQHPPLFYVLDAPAILAAKAAGVDFEGRVRAARIPSALFGALTILGLILFLARATGHATLGLAGGVLLAATPMFTHLSTGVSHDTLVACTAAWAAYWCVRWLESSRLSHLLYASFLVGACTVTKITALAMAVPLFFAIAWRLWRFYAPQGGFLAWFSRATLTWLLMFVPICLWIARSLYLFGQPFPDASILTDDARVGIGYLSFMLNFPVWEHTILNFIALVGWNGSGSGKLAWIQANGWMARYFLALFGSSSLAVIARPFLLRLHDAEWRRGLTAAGMVVIALVYSLVALKNLPVWTCLILVIALICTFLVHVRGFVRADRHEWLIATAGLCVLVFALIYYQHLWTAFTGGMRATHGRYFYPVVPFLLLVLAYPFRGRMASHALLYAAMGGLIVSDIFFLHQVIPMYGLLS
ncbi:glycosyltransferase family 39 protein [Lysobacter sp. M2-1]|uniref:glycosyltransferase family 39 protein n=1 Tax=Lysobacter sp. M2-1 TaxID=2916839 RepID=UPI001F596C8E|nr:glycosyltransferase family 39 protein [Lysobacter sp. M2-1]